MLDPNVELIAILTSITFLSIAAYFDIKERLVHDLVWLIMLVPAAALTILRIISYSNTILIEIGISLLLAFVFSFTFTVFGLWGGADSLALIMLTITHPIIRYSHFIDSQAALLNSVLPFPITIIINAYLFALIYPFGLALFNILQFFRSPQMYIEPIAVPTWKKIIATFIGYPVTVSKLEKMNYWVYELLEKKIDTGISKNTFKQTLPRSIYTHSNPLPVQPAFSRLLGITNSSKYKFISKITLDEEFIAIQKRLDFIETIKKDKRNTIWIQYTLPFLLFLLIGYLFAVFYGNLGFYIVNIIL